MAISVLGKKKDQPEEPKPPIDPDGPSLSPLVWLAFVLSGAIGFLAILIGRAFN